MLPRRGAAGYTRKKIKKLSQRPLNTHLIACHTLVTLSMANVGHAVTVSRFGANFQLILGSHSAKPTKLRACACACACVLGKRIYDF